MIIGVIPARGGSKGIRKKNIKEIAGKPLLVWTIEAAGKSKLLDDVVVSTDSEEIAQVAKENHCAVIMRSPEFATDTSPIIDTIKDVLDKTPIRVDTVVLLQPTSPIRSPHLIDLCIKTYQNLDVDSVATGFECKFKSYGTNLQQRQEYEGFGYDDGSVYVINSDIIRQGKLFTDKLKVIQTSREENVEIDDEFDFWLAEQILKKKNYKKGINVGKMCKEKGCTHRAQCKGYCTGCYNNKWKEKNGKNRR